MAAEKKKESWSLILGDPDRREMSRVVKADDPEFIVAYVIREWRNKAQQAEDDGRARLIAVAPEMAELLRELWHYSFDPAGLPTDRTRKIEDLLGRIEGGEEEE